MCDGCAKPLAQATEMLGREKMPSLSVVQPMLTALRRKHLKVSAVEPKMALDMKEVIARSLDQHFSDEDQRKLMLIASCLDPRFCRMKFLPSKERADVYAELVRIANECSHSRDEEEEVLTAKKPKVDSLLDYHEPSSESSGSSPADVCDHIEREISQYKMEEEIDSPLTWW